MRKQIYDPLESFTLLDFCVFGGALTIALVIDFFVMLEDRHATVYLVGRREERWRNRHAMRA